MIWVSNSIVLIVFAKNRTVRIAPVNHLLVSLSLVDLLNSIGLSIVIMYQLHCDVDSIKFYGLAGETINNLTILLAVGHLLLLSSERVVSMVYALRYRELVQKRRVYIALVILWISSITISNSHLTWFWSPPRERDAYDRMLSIVLLVAFALLPSL